MDASNDRADDLFRITLNSAAVRAFWTGGVGGIRLRYVAGELSFLPVSDEELHLQKAMWGDIVAARQRARGGLEFGIQGHRGPELASELKRVSTTERPYFLLRRENDGWISTSHYGRGGDPLRTQPSMRVWLPQPALPSLAIVADDQAHTYEQIVRHAANILQQWSDGRHPGRIPAEIEEAQAVMRKFAVLVEEVRQHLTLNDEVNLEKVRQARDILSGILEAFDRRTD